MGSYSRRAPEARCSRGGHYRPKEAKVGVPRMGHCRPKCPTRLPTGWHRQCWTLFRVQQGWLLTSFRQRVRRTGGGKPRVWTLALLSRPGAPAREHYGCKEPRTGVPEGDIADPQMSNEATDGLAPSVFAIFRAQLERIILFFRQRAKKDRRQDTTGSDSRHAPDAWCSRTGDIAGPNFNTAFDFFIKYSTD